MPLTNIGAQMPAPAALVNPTLFSGLLALNRPALPGQIPFHQIRSTQSIGLLL